MSKCNREQAIRAKDIAIEKMENNDFCSAQGILVEAQKIFPDLENLSQLLTICNVHCTAQKRVNKEMDWYGILQVDVAADETSIKKQYRKLAMLLHPDKNKFIGADAAFKFVVDASSVLCDKIRQSNHDFRKNIGSKYVPSEAKGQPGMLAKTSSERPSAEHTFWTMCPKCLTRYMYGIGVLNKKARCLNCHEIYFTSQLMSSETANGYTMAEATSTDADDNTTASASNSTDYEDNTITEATSTVGEKQNFYPDVLAVPKPGFKYRDVNNLVKGSGQIWALYDSHDRMPRSYAQIKCVDRTNSKVHLNWLSYVMTKEEKRKRAAKVLPVACGKFCLGKRDIVEDSAQFSHIVKWNNDKRRKLCVIYPNKGEVWAIYKGWNKQWAPENQRYEYDVVELLSNMSAKRSATVMPLVRITGFVSLFAAAKDKSPFDIPPTELLRFSHRIPFYRTTGHEMDIPGTEISSSGTKEHVSRGFLQLDTLCLPADQFEAFCSVTMDSYITLISKKSGSNIYGINESDDVFEPESPATNIYEYPDPDFHNFEEGSSYENFECGQIWALYSDLDKFPKFYGRIDKVQSKPFRVHLNWLDTWTRSEQEKLWDKMEMPISCGIFEVRKSTTIFRTTSVFSHLVDAQKTSNELQFEIFRALVRFG